MQELMPGKLYKTLKELRHYTRDGNEIIYNIELIPKGEILLFLSNHIMVWHIPEYYSKEYDHELKFLYKNKIIYMQFIHASYNSYIELCK